MGSFSSKLAVVMASIAALSLFGNTANARSWGVHRAAFLRVEPATSKNAFLLSNLRGGDETAASTGVDSPPVTHTTTTTNGDDEPSLDEKVYAAMKKLGMSPPTEEGVENDADKCKDGICPMPNQESASSSSSADTQPQSTPEQDPHVMASAIAKEMNVDSRLAMAAIGATSKFGEGNQRVYNEKAAKDMIQYELDLIERIPSDAPNVQKLVEEGYDPFLSRRALAFAEDNMDDARAILIADQMDEEEEAATAAAGQGEEEAMRAQLRAEKEAKPLDLVEVKADFDPTTLPTTPKAKPTPKQSPTDGMPKPAPKESVVFEATTAQLQELVLESPVPVLLDVYADWCG